MRIRRGEVKREVGWIMRIRRRGQERGRLIMRIRRRGQERGRLIMRIRRGGQRERLVLNMGDHFSNIALEDVRLILPFEIAFTM